MRDIGGHLRLSEENSGMRLDRESALADVANYSHNLGRSLVAPHYHDSATDRILVREVFPGKGLVDETHARTPNPVTLVEDAPIDNANAQGGEISPTDERGLGDLITSCRFWLPLEIKSGRARRA